MKKRKIIGEESKPGIEEERKNLYKEIVNSIQKPIHKLQDFKAVNSSQFNKVKNLTETLLKPFLVSKRLKKALVICDKSNNTDITKNNRQFVVTVHIKVTGDKKFTVINFIFGDPSVNSQSSADVYTSSQTDIEFVTLNLTRVAPNDSITNIINGRS